MCKCTICYNLIGDDMIYIDDLKIELLMPEVLMEYLANNNLFEVFNIIDGDYYLIPNIDDDKKTYILYTCLCFLSNELRDCVSESEELVGEYQRVAVGIQYINANSKDKIVKKLKDLIEFKERIKDYNFEDTTMKF